MVRYRTDRRSMILLERAGSSDSEQVEAAWQRFVTEGSLDRRVVRPHVARAWERSMRAGCDPRRMKADALDALNTQALLDARDALVKSARPFAAALSRTARGARHAVMLGDAEGRVLDVVGDAESVQGPEAVPGPGSLLDEASAGANGIGTPLAEGGYVELVGPEHFIEGFHLFTCQGIPLLDAEGAQVGVLGVSVRRIGTADRMRDILFCAAQAVECEMLMESLSAAVESATLPGGSELAKDMRQELLHRLSLAKRRLELAAGAVAHGGSALELLAESESLIRRFRRLADLWRELVSDGFHAPTPVVLGDLAVDLIELLRPEFRAAQVELRWGEDQPLSVLADRQALAQSLLGRLLTAVQAAGAGGAIRIDVLVSDGMATIAILPTSEDGTEGTALELIAGPPTRKKPSNER